MPLAKIVEELRTERANIDRAIEILTGLDDGRHAANGTRGNHRSGRGRKSWTEEQRRKFETAMAARRKAKE